MPWNRCVPILLAILLLGFLVRVQALRWNWFMHADAIDGVMGAATLLRDGRLAVFEGPSYPDPSVYVLPAEGGEPLLQHAPLWSILGAALTGLRGGEATMVATFLSLRILSVVAGMLVILLSFLVTVRVLGDTTASLAAAAWVAASYLLIDYAGNGAFFSLQAALYLLWILVALRTPTLHRTIILGSLAGITYLLNFQAIILVPAGVILLFVQGKGIHTMLLHSIVFLVFAGAFAFPWFIRNAIVAGDAFASHAANMWYVYGKAGFQPSEDGVLHLTLDDRFSIIAGVFHTWLPYNLYYAARKLFVLAPITFLFFSYGLIDLLFSPSRLRRALPLVAVLAFHTLLSASWPVWKFRYFVPILPLIFLLALEELWHLPWVRQWKTLCVSVTLVVMLMFSILTYRALPTHTTYYDGALTQDPFHSYEERTYLEKWGILPVGHAS